MKKRGSGVLLHITSLPSKFGIGDLGSSAYKFVDFLKETKQSYWQILPLNPTETIYGNSPYSSFSAFAANSLLTDPEGMVKEGWLDKKDIKSAPSFKAGRVDYKKVTDYKSGLFEIAYQNFKGSDEDKSDFREFCHENVYWLEDFSLFMTLKENFHGQAWNEWPKELRDRNQNSLEDCRIKFTERIERVKFLQYIFSKQWLSLKAYCNQRGVQLIGDIPIYVNYDSSDVWANQELFELDDSGIPTFVAGVPPDYFSETGQRWGNPVYKWDSLKEDGYSWWIERFRNNLQFFDIMRIDHFRGFVAYWQIPSNEETAVKGQWVEAPAKEFFETILKSFPGLSIIAEDLGVITPDVTQTMKHFGFPGMKVLLFAFNGDIKKHSYIPENYVENCVVYTGTHDNNTASGWFAHEATKEEKKNLINYLGKKTTSRNVHWELIKLAMNSKANAAIIPMQDILGLGKEARMNTPATTKGNWQWRLQSKDLNPNLRRKLLKFTESSNRA